MVHNKSNYVLVVIFVLRPVTCDVEFVPSDPDNGVVNKYKGEYFPKQYLVVDGVIPKLTELDKYLNCIKRIVKFFYTSQNHNDTTTNDAIGFFYTKVILKRVLKDFRGKLNKTRYLNIINAVRDLDYMISHYVCASRYENDDENIFKVSRFVRDDTYQIYSIEEFNRSRLNKWIFSEVTINDYVEAMDKADLPKEKYAELVDSWSKFFIKIRESDVCLTRVYDNPDPVKIEEIRPCRRDEFCRRSIDRSPSIAYTLNHRLMNLIVYRHGRRCYLYSEEEDAMKIEMLCSFMYREAVYIARRGYFSRDIFMEHIALCSLMGYEEFHRHAWFRKVASWVDDDGCLAEDLNFSLNRTRYTLNVRNVRSKKDRRIMRLKLYEECQRHPMVLGLIVMAHASRHALHFISDTVT